LTWNTENLEFLKHSQSSLRHLFDYCFHAVSFSSGDYCLTESFHASCLKNEVIFMTSATYGRMRIGRCVKAEEVDAHKAIVGDDPRYLGCSADVLQKLDQKCSGKTDCKFRVYDILDENIQPCVPGLKLYLEASYKCIYGM